VRNDFFIDASKALINGNVITYLGLKNGIKNKLAKYLLKYNLPGTKQIFMGIDKCLL